MHELIKRLEKATGPDRELDQEIWIALNPTHDAFNYNGDPRWKPYTASLDAARTLAAGFYWIASEGKTRDSEPLGGAQVFRRDYLVKPLAEAEHERVEIALCIAALKARVAITSGQRTGD